MGRTFNMIGGGGGGTDSGAYVGTTPPAAQIGKNGDYYFELGKWRKSYSVNLASSATRGTGGFEFTVSSNVSLYGVAGYARQTYSGEIIFGKADGTVLKTVSIDLVAATWVYVVYDEPLLLTPGENYVVILAGNSNTLRYTNSPTFDVPNIQYVRGRYGGFPGYNESGVIYSVDVLIGPEYPPYQVSKSYYKSSGAWSEY